MLRIPLAALGLLVPCLAASAAAQDTFSTDEARTALAVPGAVVTVGAWLDDAALGFDPRSQLRARLAGVAITDAAGIDAAAAAHVTELGEALRTRITGPMAAAAQAVGLQVVFRGGSLPVVTCAAKRRRARLPRPRPEHASWTRTAPRSRNSTLP
jgi:hypothetical protein